jgi:hypothetical protein
MNDYIILNIILTDKEENSDSNTEKFTIGKPPTNIDSANKMKYIKYKKKYLKLKQKIYI